MTRWPALISELQTADALLQRLRVTAKQQEHDAHRALTAIRDAIALLGAAVAPSPHRRVTALELTAIRSGRTLRDVAFLSGLAIDRVLAIARGDEPTAAERLALLAAVPDFEHEDGDER
jgi:hypothetical protein